MLSAEPAIVFLFSIFNSFRDRSSLPAIFLVSEFMAEIAGNNTFHAGN